MPTLIQEETTMNKNKLKMKVDELVNGFYQVPKFLFDEQFKNLQVLQKFFMR